MNEYHVKPRQNGKTLELLRKAGEQVTDRDNRESGIMKKYIPTYNAFVRHMYENGKSEWNPDEHADWELPPSMAKRIEEAAEK